MASSERHSLDCSRWYTASSVEGTGARSVVKPKKVAAREQNTLMSFQKPIKRLPRLSDPNVLGLCDDNMTLSLAAGVRAVRNGSKQTPREG